MYSYPLPMPYAVLDSWLPLMSDIIWYKIELFQLDNGCCYHYITFIRTKGWKRRRTDNIQLQKCPVVDAVGCRDACPTSLTRVGNRGTVWVSLMLEVQSRGLLGLSAHHNTEPNGLWPSASQHHGGLIVPSLHHSLIFNKLADCLRLGR